MNRESRKKLLLYTTTSSVVSQIFSLICSFVLTRLILTSFGSETNGLVSSISQFLGFISFLEMGIGAVVKAALYKPLAEGDTDEISKIVVSTKKFYKKIAYILVAYIAVLTIVFPIISKDSYSYAYTASLVIIIAISLFAQYYFGMPYQLLLNADQRTYIPTVVCCVTLILNTGISAVLIHFGASIQLVKLAASLIYVIRPLFYKFYVQKKYSLDEKIVLTEEPLKQKWNGLAQHLAYVAVNYTDIVVLTLFSTLANVSIYTVYHNVTLGIQQVISCLSVGISALLGNVLYSESKEKLQESFGLIEWAFHFLTVLLFTITGILIVPFVQVYTIGVNDANYIVPVFAVLITLAQASYSIRTPYETMVTSANYFKETQNSAIIEVILNIGISVILVNKLGLIGVAIGTFVAMSYRTIYFVLYLRKHTLDYDIKVFLKHIFVDILSVGLCVYFCESVFSFSMNALNWVSWIILAVKVGCLCAAVCLGMNILFNSRYLKEMFNTVIRTIKNKLITKQ